MKRFFKFNLFKIEMAVKRIYRAVNFRRFVDAMTILFVIVVLSAIFLHSCQRQQLKADIASLSDQEYILNNLQMRNADDCKVTPIENGGWMATEIKSGKIFIVRRPM